MPGAIYLSTGPSGAGKDTLLLGACKALSAGGNGEIEFIKRHITRDPSRVTDFEVPVSADVFAAACEAGEYALHWSAHGTRYAIPVDELERGIAAGKRMVINTSRTMIDEVLEEYGAKRGLEVYCLNITASEAILRERLLSRGRETIEDVNGRVARAKELEPQGAHVITVVNETSVSAGVIQVLRALQYGMRPPGTGPLAETACTLGLLGGGESWYITKLSAIGAAFYEFPAQLLLTPSSRPKHKGVSVGEFAAAHGNPIALQMVNRAKMCPACGKHCAVTLTACNACAADLGTAVETSTDNVVMGFIYGVAKGPRGPLALSLRHQEESVLVYDDPLARSTCHLNAVPTDVHLADWRPLLRRPATARALLQKLRNAADQALETSYWACDGWRSSVLRPGSVCSAADLSAHAIVALNAVPSQYQLHLHYIVPPLLPNDWHALLTGDRFSRGRWLPLEYLDAALAVLEAHGSGIDGAEEMSTEQCLASLEAKGAPNYHTAFDAALKRYAVSHCALANWRAECFDLVASQHKTATKPGAYHLEHVVIADDDARAVPMPTMGDSPTDKTLETAASKELLMTDKRLLGSYGRPYEDGKPSPVGYYAHARGAGDVMEQVAWVDDAHRK